MNKIALFQVLILFLGLIHFPLYAQPGGNTGTLKIKLRLPSDLYFEMAPYRRKQNRIVFNVDALMEGLAIITSDNQTSSIFRQAGMIDTMQKRKTGYLIASPTCDSIVIQDIQDTSIYYFGKGGGEDLANNVHAAEVKIYFSEDADPSIKRVRIKDRVKFGVEANKVRSLKGDPSDLTEPPEHGFIKIEPSGSKKVTLFIDEEPRRGNVLVSIFNANNGRLLATLDPKKQGQRFTTKNKVYVFPLIRPYVISTGTGTKITFQVGDPKVNGSV
ncbi:MAG TPA: hypothetical protein PKL70_04775, partial [Saprospiraceae bacterium]|nr:hypothetical protein [Saprospiraceae bacterium]